MINLDKHKPFHVSPGSVGFRNWYSRTLEQIWNSRKIAFTSFKLFDRKAKSSGAKTLEPQRNRGARDLIHTPNTRKLARFWTYLDFFLESKTVSLGFSSTATFSHFVFRLQLAQNSGILALWATVHDQHTTVSKQTQSCPENELEVPDCFGIRSWALPTNCEACASFMELVLVRTPFDWIEFRIRVSLAVVFSCVFTASRWTRTTNQRLCEFWKLVLVSSDYNQINFNLGKLLVMSLPLFLRRIRLQGKLIQPSQLLIISEELDDRSGERCGG